jgi:hypothetical protein
MGNMMMIMILRQVLGGFWVGDSGGKRELGRAVLCVLLLGVKCCNMRDE